MAHSIHFCALALAAGVVGIIPGRRVALGVLGVHGLLGKLCCLDGVQLRHQAHVLVRRRLVIAFMILAPNSPAATPDLEEHPRGHAT